MRNKLFAIHHYNQRANEQMNGRKQDLPRAYKQIEMKFDNVSDNSVYESMEWPNGFWNLSHT